MVIGLDLEYRNYFVIEDTQERLLALKSLGPPHQEKSTRQVLYHPN
jgi:hypothetical protein